MKKLILLLTLSAFIHPSWGCFLDIKNDILIYKNMSRDLFSSIIQKSTCTEAINSLVLDVIQNSSGSLSIDSLRALIKRQEKKKVRFTQNELRIKTLEKIIKDNVSLKNQFDIKKVQALTPTLIQLRPEQRYTIDCHNCDSLGQKNVKLNVQTVNQTRSYWFTIEIHQKIWALVPKKMLLYSQKPLRRDDFKKVSTTTDQPQIIFQDFENIEYYHTTRILQTNDVVKKLDLSPINLVKMGFPTEILLKNGAITLKGQGQPLQFGKYGDYIRVRNQRTNKILSAKVIGPNKVLVEL